MQTLSAYNSKKMGAVYTPDFLAEYVAQKLINCYFVNKEKINSNLKILDPACGNGVLLSAAWAALHSKFKTDKVYLKKLSISSVLCGVDISKKAINETKKTIERIEKRQLTEINIINTNALNPFGKSYINGWSLIREKFNAVPGFDLIIANPPWGADTSSYREEILPYFSLMNGQFDTSDLFIELALSQLKIGGMMAFIVPDSLFAQEREKLRRILLKDTKIKFIGRFGEKLFEHVSRGCAVIICEKSNHLRSNSVNCLRLTPKFRKAILNSQITLAKVEEQEVHKVPQSRFENNLYGAFDIDLKESETNILTKLTISGRFFGNLLMSSRGVELSKSGKLSQCPYCNYWMPYPTSDVPQCIHCRKKLILQKLKLATIVSDKPRQGMFPLIVGENISRYKLSSNYWIQRNVPGVNYKSEALYEGPKIVVRKTGVGISAAIDYENAFTNQVVYIFKFKNNEEVELPLESLLAIMNSRAIYYYISKRHGETEWRSHPYLTQQQILELPLPNGALPQNQKRKIVAEISTIAKPYLKTKHDIPSHIDAKIEFFIAQLYGLSMRDYKTIFNFLNSVEELLPIKKLKSLNLNDIFCKTGN